MQQVFGVAETYGRRLSLVAALGLTMCDPDTDGAPGTATKYITEEQANSLNDFIIQTDSNKAKLLEIYGVKQIVELNTVQYADAIAKLKIKQQRKAAT